MNINFAFIRHGYGCHNAMVNLVNSDTITEEAALDFMRVNNDNVFSSDLIPLNDPVLTQIGVDASVYNGCILNKIFKNLNIIYKNEDLKMDKINIVGCSPLIRSMETAYYMSRDWKNPPDQIYVLPLLREIDESSDNKYSSESLNTIKITPSYAMKSIEEQKEYLEKLGILKYFNFSFVESFPRERIKPGDINKFIGWFCKYYISLIKNKMDNVNVFIITHAGVLKEFSREGFYNNSGFVLNSKLDNKIFTLNKYISLNDHIKDYNFFKDYRNEKYNNKAYYCPSDRCGQLCSVSRGYMYNKIKTIDVKCDNGGGIKLPNVTNVPKFPNEQKRKKSDIFKGLWSK